GGAAADIGTLIDAIHYFLKTDPSSSAAIDEIRRDIGLKGIRECFDILRRWDISTTIAKDLKTRRSTILAYWRQEGGYCISPPASSFAFAPLINTDRGDCRTPYVSFSADGRRDGFDLSLANDDHTTRSSNFALSVRLTNASLLTLGGLDQLVVPLLAEDDELWLLFKAAARHPGGLKRLETWIPQDVLPNFLRDFTQGFLQSTVKDFDEPAKKETQAERVQRNTRAGTRHLVDIMAGLASVNMEIGLETPLPTFVLPYNPENPKDPNRPTSQGAERLLENAIDRLIALLLAHFPVVSPDGKHTFLKANDNSAETLQVIYTGYQLIEIKRSLRSLLAFRDRKLFPELKPLSDFMTYLRFHLGDTLFTSYLLHIGAYLHIIAKSGEFKRGSPFAQALEGFPQGDLLEIVNTCKSLLKEWAKPGQQIQSIRLTVKRADMKDAVWRHIGLLDELRTAPQVPTWLPVNPKIAPALANGAKCASELVLALYANKGLPIIETFLAQTDFTTLAKLATKHRGLFPLGNLVQELAPISKAQSFTRLAGTIAEAMGQAKVEDMPATSTP
ncbi:MAG: hypothetical protein KF726_26980, partial [Anaerolineae bacterium]|nr:hypothetical protein [Anaerolineae bacterium]